MPDDTPAPIIVVTGTSAASDTTVVTAALVVGFQDEGLTVAVEAAVRTGTQDESVGLPRLGRLTGIAGLSEHTRLAEPFPPVPAATAAGQDLSPVPLHAARWARRCRSTGLDILLIDESEGLLTPIDADGSTMLDLLDTVQTLGIRCGVIVVTGTGPDDLRHAAVLTASLRSRSQDILGCVLDRCPPDGVDPASRACSDYLPRMLDVPVLGCIPPDAGDWDPQLFQDRAGAWLPLT